MATGVLIKNASLWQWPETPSTKHSAGSVIQRSWFCIENGVITDSSINTLDGGPSEPPLEEKFHRVIDAKHQLVIPGLHDAHIHIAMTGESNYFLNLKGCSSIEMLVSSLSNHSVKFPSAVLPWISGVNWDQVCSRQLLINLFINAFSYLESSSIRTISHQNERLIPRSSSNLLHSCVHFYLPTLDRVRAVSISI